MVSDGFLFAELDLARVKDAQLEKMFQEIDEYERSQLLNTSPEDIAAYFVERFRLDPPELLESEIVATENETQIDVRNDPGRAIFDRGRPALVPGVKVEVRIPFSGDPDLFRCRPSRYGMNPPQGVVRGSTLTIKYKSACANEEDLKNWFDRTLNGIRDYLATIATDVASFNQTLHENAIKRINLRRNRILDNQGLVASLGVRLETRGNAPRTFAAPDIKRIAPPRKPPASSEPFVPEPALADAQYEQILGILRSMATTIERDPGSFRTLSEESIRSVFLVALNSQFEGRATGETFNASGKTDVLIRENDRNVFIAECKFWKGPKSVTSAIDQVLGYACWRDTKTAILMFCKVRDFSKIVEKINPTVQSHRCFKELRKQPSETEWQYRFGHADDPTKDLTLTVLAFHLRGSEG